MIKRRYKLYVAIGFLIAVASGCVTRTINIETTPTSAMVFLDDKYVGKSPVSIPFSHYGTRKITIEKRDDDGRLVLKRKVSFEKIKVPYYETFPLGFVYEVILPKMYEDKHDFKYELEELDVISIEDKKAQMLENAKELKESIAEW